MLGRKPQLPEDIQAAEHNLAVEDSLVEEDSLAAARNQDQETWASDPSLHLGILGFGRRLEAEEQPSRNLSVNKSQRQKRN